MKKTMKKCLTLLLALAMLLAMAVPAVAEENRLWFLLRRRPCPNRKTP